MTKRFSIKRTKNKAEKIRRVPLQYREECSKLTLVSFFPKINRRGR